MSEDAFEETQLDATADDALCAIEEAGDRAQALVDAWVKRGNAAAVDEVARAGSGRARKAARRGLNVLKARGIAIPSRKRVSKLAIRGEETFAAQMVPPDGAGTSMLVLWRRSPAGKLRGCFIILGDGKRLLQVDSGDMTTTQLRESIEKFTKGTDAKAVDVPIEWARARIAAARAHHEEKGFPEPLGLSSASDLLEPVPNEAPTHPFDAEGLELSDDDAKSLAAESNKLHTLPEFRSWLPGREAVDEMMLKVGEGLTPGEEPDPEAVSKKLEEEAEAATDRYFTPERRELLIDRMRDSAISVLARHGEQKALELVAAMKVIRTAGLITDPPRDIPFLRGFFQKAIAIMAAQGGGRLNIPIPKGPLGGDGASADAASG